MDEEKVTAICPLSRKRCTMEDWGACDPHPVCALAEEGTCMVREVLDGTAKLLAQLLDGWQENPLQVEVVA